MTPPATTTPPKPVGPHGLAFAPIKVGVLIDIDMGTIRVAPKCRAVA